MCWKRRLRYWTNIYDVEEFGRLESREETIAILGDRWCSQTTDGETGRGKDKQVVSR